MTVEAMTGRVTDAGLPDGWYRVSEFRGHGLIGCDGCGHPLAGHRLDSTCERCGRMCHPPGRPAPPPHGYAQAEHGGPSAIRGHYRRGEGLCGVCADAQRRGVRGR